MTLRSSTPPLPPQLPWNTATPSNPREIDCQTAWIEAKLRRSSTSPSAIVSALRQSAKGHHKTAAELALLRAEIVELQEAVHLLGERKSRKRKRHKVEGSVDAAGLSALIVAKAANKLLSQEVVEVEAESSQAVRRQPTCSTCGIQGHTRVSCRANI